jgi:glucoamylase
MLHGHELVPRVASCGLKVGEDVFIVGSLTKLGNWAPDSAVPHIASQYTQDDPLWFAEIDLPAETTFEYKYIKKTSGGVVWESDPNRRYTTSTGCGSSGTQNDEWR